MRKLLPALFALPIVLQFSPVFGDIFQWEYINPAEPSQGKQQSTTLAPDGAGVDAAPGADLADRNLTMAYLTGAKLHSTTYCDWSGCYARQSNLSGTILINADLSSADFNAANLVGANLSGANLTNANVTFAVLTNADLSDAGLTNANFVGATLTGADFTNATVRRASFDVVLDFLSFFATTANKIPTFRFGTGITLDQLYATASYHSHDLTGIGLRNHALSDVNFAGQNLAEANLSGAGLSGANLRNANLENASFTLADLTNADLTDASVRGASFHKYSNPNNYLIAHLGPDGTGITPQQLYSTASYKARDLTNLDVSGNDLTGANLSRQKLINADFSTANLTYASLDGANLTDADFTDADVHGANFAPIVYHPPFIEDVVLGTGINLEQLYSTASYRAHVLSGIGLSGHDLTNANFSGQNLRDADFGADSSYSEYSRDAATLTGANFTDADLRQARFDHATLTATDFNGADVRGASFLRNPYVSPRGTGITPAQLHSTSSYQARDLNGTDFGGNLFAGGEFAGQKLTNSSFGNLDYEMNWQTGQPEWQIYYATITGADFTGADTRGAHYLDRLDVSGATTTNLIRPDGHINGLDLTDSQLLAVRDYDFGVAIPYPFPITVDQHFAMGSGGTLRMAFEADAWDSTISFATGIPVTLGGTLELTFADDVNLASQVGRTFDLFDWTGINPTGTFAVSSPYAWDLSNLYTNGEVTLTAVPEPASLVTVAAALGIPILRRWRRSHASEITFQLNK